MVQNKSKAKYGGKLAADFPPEQRAAIHLKAGKNSVAAKRKRKAAKEVLQDLLASDSTDKSMIELANQKGVEGTELATLLIKMMKKAGNSAQMAELVFKLTGDLEQAPQQNITIINGMSDEQLMAERARLLGNNAMIDVTPKPPEIDK